MVTLCFVKVVQAECIAMLIRYALDEVHTQLAAGHSQVPCPNAIAMISTCRWSFAPLRRGVDDFDDSTRFDESNVAINRVYN